MALLAALDGRELDADVSQAAQLVGTVVGQDLDHDGQDGVLRIARRVAKDRVISTVDPDARHGHKTAARGFDGYKGHAATDPDSEIITATTVTPGNVGDAAAAEDLITDLITDPAEQGEHADTEQGEHADTEQGEHADTEQGEHADTEQGEHADAEQGEQADTQQAEPGNTE